MNLLLESGKRFNHQDDFVQEFRQPWNNRLDFPPTKILERYLRKQLAVALELKCNLSGIQLRIGGLVTFDDIAHIGGKVHSSSREAQHDLSMFIDNVHAVKNEQGIVERIGSVVRLQLLNQIPKFDSGDSLYFSFVTGDTVFIDWPRFANGELDEGGVLGTVLRRRELPDNVIQNGSKVMNDLSGQNGEADRNGQLLVVGNCLKQGICILLWNLGVCAGLEKSADLGLEITDVLVGPF